MPNDKLKNKPDADNVVVFKASKCPHCQSSSTFQFRPFCSKRCADIDLGNWLNESYCIQSDEQNDLDESTTNDE